MTIRSNERYDNTNKTINTRMVKIQAEHEPPATKRPERKSDNENEGGVCVCASRSVRHVAARSPSPPPYFAPCTRSTNVTLVSQACACEKRHFCAIYISKRSFCQAGLGTNIGKTQKKMPFFAPPALTPVWQDHNNPPVIKTRARTHTNKRRVRRQKQKHASKHVLSLCWQSQDRVL